MSELQFIFEKELISLKDVRHNRYVMENFLSITKIKFLREYVRKTCYDNVFLAFDENDTKSYLVFDSKKDASIFKLKYFDKDENGKKSD